jgi:hypothetical protein
MLRRVTARGGGYTWGGGALNSHRVVRTVRYGDLRRRGSTMRDQRSSTRQIQPDEATIADWFWLGVVALVLMPVAGVLVALLALDVTRSFPAHVATAAVLPAALVTLMARRFGASSGLVLRLALMAALFALVLLDLGWSGGPG